MNVLESIRKRTGLLVGMVGLALVIFILESLLSSGNSIFGGDSNTVAIINGKKVDRVEFYNKVEAQLNAVRQNRQSNDIDESTRRQVVDYVMQSFISELVVKPEYNKLGLAVGDDELYENMVLNPGQLVTSRLTDRNTGMIYEQLAAPDGSLDPNKFRAFVTSATGDQELFVKQMEEDVINTRLAEKYSNLVKKGMYVTSKEAKNHYDETYSKLDISFVMKRYDAVSDSIVKVSEDDLNKYYNEHKYKYINPKTVRKIEYVAFSIIPSESDVAAIEKDAYRVAEDFKGKTPAEDSILMMNESIDGTIVIQDFTKDNIIIRDTSVFTDPIGTVYGPYNEGAFFKIYKLREVREIADSARVRHILVALNDPQTNEPKRPKERAKKVADSLLVLIKEKKVSFDSLVVNFSDDMGSKTNGGDYGWFDENKNFVEPFKNAGLMGTTGNISVVETQFGYHIIEVLETSESRHTSYRLAQIFKPIEASEDTKNQIFENAKRFAGENSTGELFDKGVEKQKLTKRLADNIMSNDPTIPGLENGRDLVRWVYNAEKGDVNLFSYNDRHLVVKLASIKEKGFLPLEEVKEDVTVETIQAKKAEKFKSEIESKLAGGNDLKALAGALGVEVINQKGLSPRSHNVEGVGHDDVLVGYAYGTKKGNTTKAIIGEAGVFVLKVNDLRLEADAQQTLKDHTKMLEQMYSYRADAEFYSALKEKANIEDFTGKFE
ncbi:MAG: SurA N-terminal domain-containing protein [Bacteroidia bacterium]